MKIKQTILTLLLTFIGLGAYADEITVYDGTEESFYVPFCGYNASNGTRSQYIIPADLLVNVEGCNITKLTFYSPSNYASRSFDEGVTVYLKEVNYTTFSSATFEEWSSMTPVYTGTIGVGSDSHTVIDFDSPYSYNGGNLMIGFQVTTWGTTSQYVRWYSVNATYGTGLYENAGTDHSWSGSGIKQSSVPKTTLTYEESNTTCPRPTNLTASVTNGHTATVTWESDFTSFNLRYKVSSGENWTEVNNLTTKSYTLTTLIPETNYTVQVQAIGNNETSKWASVSFSTPSSVPAPTELTCTAKSSTFVTLSWTQNGEETAWQICLDNDEEHLINVTQNPYTFNNLITGQAYTAKVRAVNSTGDEYSKWSNVISFTPSDEITVYDGTDYIYNIPFCGNSANKGTRSQFIIPADQLTAMDGCDITKLTFYTYSGYESRSFDEGVTVYLKEVDYTTFASTAFEDWSSMTPVYTGTIGVNSDCQMVINFDSPYSYDGGNLMIGFQVTTWGTTNKYVKWYGASATYGMGLYEDAGDDHSWSGSGTKQSTVPKTTIAYEASSATCPKPTNLTASVANSHTATMTWESDFTSFNLRYKVSSEENWTEVNSLTTKSYTLATLSPEASYTVQVQAIGNNETSKWASASFDTPSSIPAPTELTCTDQTSTFVTLGWTQNGEETAWQICLNNDEEHLINVTQNPYTFTNLTAGSAYTVKVRAITNTGDEYSKWSNVVSFALIDELTVYDGTDQNMNIPMPVNDFNQYTRTQYVIPASDLTDMADGTITGISLYTTINSMPYTTAATVDVYLKEVNTTTISSFVDKATATTVYQGQIEFVKEGTGGMATITFANPYQYNGGNLLIGFENTTKPEGEYISFYGTDVTWYSAVYRKADSVDELNDCNQRKYIPKTTFNYTAFVGTPKPTSLLVSDITAHAAKVTWKGRLNTFNLRYKESTATDWTEVNGLIKKSYNLTNLRSGKTYEVEIQTVDYDETSKWASISFNTIAMPTPAPLYCATVTANSATLEWIKKGDENAWQICLDGDETNLISATTNPHTLTGLTKGQSYSAKVRAVNSTGDEWSAWSEAVSFTTTDLLSLTPPTIEGYEGVYDGEPHQFRVVSNPDGATLRFGYAVGNCTRTAADLGYRVNAGTYIYYWEATKDGYNTVTGSVQVIIHKAQGTISYAKTNIDKFADDESFINPLTIEGDGTVTYSSYNPQFATVSETGLVAILGIGWTDITAEVTDGQNYTYANKEAKYGLAMTKRKADSYKARMVVWLNSGLLTDLTFDSEPELTYDESTRLVSVTGTALAWPLKNMRKLTFTRALPNFIFNEEDDNSDVVIDGYQCDFTLNRTFRTGGYNTFAVPFSVSLDVLKSVLGAETIVKELTASSMTNDKLSMTFTDATTIEAGKPYFVKVTADVVNPTFKDIIVRNVSTTVTTDYVNVVPAIGKTLVKGVVGSEDNAQSVLFLAGGNQFKHPTVVNQPDDEDSYLKGFRAYFQLHDGAIMANDFTSNLDDDLTGIHDVRSQMEDGRSDIFDMQGRKVQSPTKKGIYIINGKKVVIR
jgi:hypothetical protein